MVNPKLFNRQGLAKVNVFDAKGETPGLFLQFLGLACLTFWGRWYWDGSEPLCHEVFRHKHGASCLAPRRFCDSLHDMMNDNEKTYRSIQKALAAFMQLVDVSFSGATSTNRQSMLFISQNFSFPSSCNYDYDHPWIGVLLICCGLLHHLPTVLLVRASRSTNCSSKTSKSNMAIWRAACKMKIANQLHQESN